MVSGMFAWRTFNAYERMVFKSFEMSAVRSFVRIRIGNKEQIIKHRNKQEKLIITVVVFVYETLDGASIVEFRYLFL